MFTRDSSTAEQATSQMGGVDVRRPQGARTRRGTRRASGGTSLVGAAGGGTVGSRRIDKFITSCEFIHVKLLRCAPDRDSARRKMRMGSSGGGMSASASSLPPRWHAEELGEAKLPLKQFKSSYVNKHDVFAPMGLELGMCSLRATIGLELTRRDVNSAVLLSDPGLREVHSVYVPSPGFRTTDPLPRDWFEVLREPPFHGTQQRGAVQEESRRQQPDNYEMKRRGGYGSSTTTTSNNNYTYDSGEPLPEGMMKEMKEEHATAAEAAAAVTATASPSHGPTLALASSSSAPALHGAEPIWHITLQVHSLHNIPRGGTATDDESLFCQYSFLGKIVRSQVARASPANREGEGEIDGEGDEGETSADLQILHTEELFLQCTWVKLQRYFQDNPTLQIDVHRPVGGADIKFNAAEYTDMTPAFSSYLNLEDFATLKTIDGTYDMICIDNKTSGFGYAAAAPPYLAASLYLAPADSAPDSEVRADVEEEDGERRDGARVRRLPNAGRDTGRRI